MMLEGDNKAAIGMFQSSLNFGELNLTYVNLGRALYKVGHCEAAQKTYRKARTAPKVAEPTPEEIETLLVRFETELADACSATLFFTCTPENAQIKIDDRDAQPCTGGRAAVTAGNHRVVGIWAREAPGISVEVPAGATVTIALQEPEPEPVAQPTRSPAETYTSPAKEPTASAVAEAVQASQFPTPPASNGFAWGLIGGGTAGLVAAAILNYTYVADAKKTFHAACQSTENGTCTVDAGQETAAEDARNSYQNAQISNRIVTGVGAIAAAAGVAMLVYSGGESGTSSGVFFLPRHRGGEVGWNWTW
jgi:hypothetical protein